MSAPTGKSAPGPVEIGRGGFLRSLRARPRLVVAALIFVVGGLALWHWMHLRPATSLLLGFDVAALVYLLSLVSMFIHTNTEALIRGQARTQDTGRWGVLWSSVGLTGVVSLALTTEMGAARGGGALALIIAAASIVLSWLFMNTMFALHYAHGYYGDFGEQHQGLQFPDTPKPDYWDFAYFAIVIGMTFQVSDVQITSRYLRRVALLHSVIAFFFNVFIIAISVNIAAGLAG